MLVCYFYIVSPHTYLICHDPNHTFSLDLQQSTWGEAHQQREVLLQIDDHSVNILFIIFARFLKFSQLSQPLKNYVNTVTTLALLPLVVWWPFLINKIIARCWELLISQYQTETKPSPSRDALFIGSISIAWSVLEM